MERIIAPNGLRVRRDSPTGRRLLAEMIRKGVEPTVAERMPELATHAAQLTPEQQWRADHADVAAWLDAAADGNQFAASLRAGLARYGSLTERQVAAARSAMQRQASPAPDRSAPIDVSRIEAAFESARGAGLIRLRMTLGEGIKFSPAGEGSRNAGGLYVKSSDGTYLGKVLGGKFSASRDCSDEQREEVIRVASNPAEEARAYGMRTGRCSICGLQLTDPASIDAGIGPICAEKFGFSA